MNLLKNKKGFTLLELILVIALLAILSLGIFSALKLGTNTFKKGEDLGYNRTNVKFAADFINNELKTATHIKIVENIPDLDSFNTGNENFGYKSLYIKDGILYQITTSIEEKSRQFGVSEGPLLKKALNFTIDNSLLYFKVSNNPTASLLDDYSISSKIKLLNYPLIELIYSSSQDVIIYKSDSLVLVSGIHINEGNQTIDKNSQFQFTASIFPDDAANKNIIWSSSNPNIATVNSLGQVFGVSSGTTLITVTSEDGLYSDIAQVIVSDNTSNSIPIENVFVYGTTFNINGNNQVSIDNNSNGTIVITNDNNKDITFGGNVSLDVKNIYIDKTGNSIKIKGSSNLGLENLTEIINLSGDLDVSGATSLNSNEIFIDGFTSISGSSQINGKEQILIDGGTNLEGVSSITSNVVQINGDLLLDNSSSITASELYIYGDLIIDSGTSSISANEIYISGDVIIKNSVGINNPSNTGSIFIKGNLLLESWNNNISVNDIHIEGTTNLGKGSYLSANEIYLNGLTTLNQSSTIKNFTSLFINENLYLPGKFSKILGGTSYIYGDISIEGSGANIEGNLAYTGTLNSTQGISANIITPNPFPPYNHIGLIPLFEAIPPNPEVNMPILKPRNWYINNGYSLNSHLWESNTNIYYEGNFYNGSWQDIENVIIIATGDVNISGNGKFTGIIIAPNGKVSYSGRHFEGLVIAKDGFYLTQGNAACIFKSISNYIDDINKYPFEQ